MTRWRIALAQINTLVGDLEGNAAKIEAGIQQAQAVGADIVVFPELAVTGYPPEDLLLKPAFLQANIAIVERLAAATQGITAIVGFADDDDAVYNAAAFLYDGAWVHTNHKQYLPNYSVFDEDLYFRRGQEVPVYKRDGVAFGVSVCEDIWYPAGPPEIQALQGGARLLVNISASPYHAGKTASRENMIVTRAMDNAAVIVFCNLVGGQDELVFDGGSMVMDPAGRLIASAKSFEQDLLVTDIELDTHPDGEPLSSPGRGCDAEIIEIRAQTPQKTKRTEPPRAPELDRLDEIWRALVLGTRDYVKKNDFEKAVIGLSGGIDSSLTACISVEAPPLR